MNAARLWSVGFLLMGALAGAVVFAQQSIPGSNPFGPGQEVPTPAPALSGPSKTAVYSVNRGSVQDFTPSHMQSQSTVLAQQYVKAEKEEEKKEIRKKLADVLSQQFDLHLQQQQKELEELEKQIASLKALLKKRQGSKATIVERRLEQLVQEAEGLGWNAPGRPRTGLTPMSGHAPLEKQPAPAAIPSRQSE